MPTDMSSHRAPGPATASLVAKPSLPSSEAEQSCQAACGQSHAIASDPVSFVARPSTLVRRLPMADIGANSWYGSHGR